MSFRYTSCAKYYSLCNFAELHHVLLTFDLWFVIVTDSVSDSTLTTDYIETTSLVKAEHIGIVIDKKVLEIPTGM